MKATTGAGLECRLEGVEWVFPKMSSYILCVGLLDPPKYITASSVLVCMFLLRHCYLLGQSHARGRDHGWMLTEGGRQRADANAAIWSGDGSGFQALRRES